MNLTPGFMVCALLHYVLMILLVMLLDRVCRFCTNRSRSQMLRFCVCWVHINRSQFQRWSTHRNVLALKFLILPPNFIISFVLIVMVWLFRTHSNCCWFTKNMILRAPMGYICCPLNPGSGRTKDTAFIKCAYGQDPQIHEVWSLVSDMIIHEFHPI